MRIDVIDAIRQELRKQANMHPEKFKMQTVGTDKPDTVRVNGTLDIYELAKAVLNR